MSSPHDLDFDEYQTRARSTAIYPEVGTGSPLALAYVGLGLGEAGEVQGKIKKIIRDSGGKMSATTREALAAELGDLLWYIAQTASEISVPMATIAQGNLDKLASRQQRGVLGGSGDDR